MRPIVPSSALVCTALLACTSSDEPAPSTPPPECRVDRGTTCEPGEGGSLELTIESLSFAGYDDDEDPGPIDGFDLDCRVSDSDDAETCYRADETSRDGQPGIDNAAGGALDVIGVDVDPDRLPSLAIRVSGVGNRADDDCVAVTLIDVESGRELSRSSHASITDGHLHAMMTNMELTLPLVTASETDPMPVAELLTLVLEEPHLAADLEGDRPVGLIGGHAGTDHLISTFATAFEGEDPGILSFIRTVVESEADLSREPDWSCSEVSVALAFEASQT